MQIIIFRTIIIYITLIIIMRLMGKRQIGEMQPFELVITLLIAELACAPMADISIPLMYGIVAILAIFVLHQLISLLEQGGQFLKKVISGKPSLVLTPNGVDFKELRKNNLDVEDLIESMRSDGYFALDDLKYGIFEANGKFSALENLDTKQKEPTLPIILINNGKVNEKNLEMIKKEPEWLKELIKQQGAKSYKDMLVMTLDSEGKVYYQEKYKKFKVFNVDTTGMIKW